MLEAVAEGVLAHEMQLFDRIAQVCGDTGQAAGSTFLVEQLKAKVAGLAAARSLDRYAHDYRWYENL